MLVKNQLVDNNYTIKLEMRSIFFQKKNVGNFKLNNFVEACMQEPTNRQQLYY